MAPVDSIASDLSTCLQYRLSYLKIIHFYNFSIEKDMFCYSKIFAVFLSLRLHVSADDGNFEEEHLKFEH